MSILCKEDILKVVLNATDTTYLTHNFHPYPAKFIPQIPNLTIKWFTKKNETVFDPFCGSGTSLVEAKLLGRKSIGVDIHPLGVFMSKVKTTKIPEDELGKVLNFLKILEKRVDIFVAKSQKCKTLLSFAKERVEG